MNLGNRALESILEMRYKKRREFRRLTHPTKSKASCHKEQNEASSLNLVSRLKERKFSQYECELENSCYLYNPREETVTSVYMMPHLHCQLDCIQSHQGNTPSCTSEGTPREFQLERGITLNVGIPQHGLGSWTEPEEKRYIYIYANPQVSCHLHENTKNILHIERAIIKFSCNHHRSSNHQQRQSYRHHMTSLEKYITKPY